MGLTHLLSADLLWKASDLLKPWPLFTTGLLDPSPEYLRGHGQTESILIVKRADPLHQELSCGQNQGQEGLQDIQPLQGISEQVGGSNTEE